MVNRKGWLRVVEASVAIIIVLSALLIMSRQVNVGSSVQGVQGNYIGEMALDYSMRNEIIGYNLSLSSDELTNKEIISHLENYLMQLIFIDQIT